MQANNATRATNGTGLAARGVEDPSAGAHGPGGIREGQSKVGTTSETARRECREGCGAERWKKCQVPLKGDSERRGGADGMACLLYTSDAADE